MLLRSFSPEPDTQVAELNGDWRGTYTSDVTNTGDMMFAHFDQARDLLSQKMSTSFFGRVGMAPCIFPEIVGTIDAQGRILLIAQGEREYVIIQGQQAFQDPAGYTASITGSYVMVHLEGLQDSGRFQIKTEKALSSEISP